MSDALLSAIKAAKEKEVITGDRLDMLASCIKEMRTLESVIASTESELSQYRKKLEQLSRQEIPSLLLSCDVNSVRLKTGETIDVNSVVKASLPIAKVEAAYAALCATGFFKQEQLDVCFKKQAVCEELSDEQIGSLKSLNLPFILKREIHYQTLNKLVRELMSKGFQVPPEINVFCYSETKIR